MKLIKIINLILAFSLLFAAARAQERNMELVVQTGHSAEVRSVAFNQNGEILATGSREEVKIWEVKTKRELRTLKSPGFYGNVKVAFHPNGELITINPPKRGAAIDNSINYWDLTTGKEIKTNTRAVDFIAYSRDGKVVGFVNNQTITLQNALTAEEILKIEESSPVLSIALSSDGGRLAFVADNAIQIWNVKQKTETNKITNIESPIAVSFSPDNQTLAIGSANGVEILNLSNNQKNNLPEYQGLVYSVAYSPNGNFLAGGVFGVGNDVSAKIWDLTNNYKMTSFTNTISVVTAATFSPNGKMLAVGDRDANVKILDSTKGQIKVFKGHGSRVKSLVFSPDGMTLASATSYASELKLWNITAEKEVSYAQLPGWAAGLSSIEKNFDEVLINGQKILADAKTEKVLKLFKVVGKEETEIASIFFGEEKEWLVTTPAGFFDGTPSIWKHLFWRLNNKTFNHSAVELYSKDFFYPNLLRDILAGKSPQPKAGRKPAQIR